MNYLLYWLTSFRGEDFKTFVPIVSYVKTTVCLLKVAILDGGQGHWTSFADRKFKMATMTRLNFNIGPYGKNV
jgi:hypothetical protein